MLPSRLWAASINRLIPTRRDSTTELPWNFSRLSGVYVAQSSLGSRCQSVNPDWVGTLPLSYAGSPFEKRRVRIVAHDSLEATAKAPIDLQIDAYCLAATIFKVP